MSIRINKELLLKEIENLKIIESGVNNYGYYIKFFEGTLIQYVNTVIPAGNDSLNIVFPVEFKDNDYALTILGQYNNYRNVSFTYSQKEKGSINIYPTWSDVNVSGSPIDYPQNINLTVIGKWK